MILKLSCSNKVSPLLEVLRQVLLQLAPAIAVQDIKFKVETMLAH